MMGMSKTGNTSVLKPTGVSHLMSVLPRKVEALRRKKKKVEKTSGKKKHIILTFKEQVAVRK